MIKFLLNCSTLTKGGALQVALSAIEDALNDNEIAWYFAVTKPIFLKFEKLLKVSLVEKRVIILDNSPSRNRSARKQLQKSVEENQFNAVFTLFGPSYVTFNAPHLCGIADGWVTHSNKMAYQSLGSIKEQIRVFLLCQYKLWWYKKSDKWCVEASVARDGFLNKTKVSSDSVVVIPNAVNSAIQKYASIKIEKKLGKSVDIFCLGADYGHKNYQIIPEVINGLIQRVDKKIQFFVTLPDDSPVYLKLMDKAKKLKVEDHIINLGSLTLDEVVSAYKKYNILFFPSLLETFSITPLEALYMNMPMIVSNIQANQDIVDQYATYVEPLNCEDIVEKFVTLISNYNQEVKKLSELKETNYFETISDAKRRFNAYKDILRVMIG